MDNTSKHVVNCQHIQMKKRRSFWVQRCSVCSLKRFWPFSILKCQDCPVRCHKKCLHRLYETETQDRAFETNISTRKDGKELENEITNHKRVTNDFRGVSIRNSPTNIVQQSIDPRHSQTSAILEDFTFVNELGKGAFGKVMLCQHKRSEQFFAIKTIKKSSVIAGNQIDNLKAEKNTFQIANEGRHPFLLKLLACFQTEDRVFFVTEYAAGGDLRNFMEHERLPESAASFYAACVVLGLQTLHEKNIIHRDIKLENLLLGADGYLKIADFGLCKDGMGYGDATRTICGTKSYFAPEMLTDKIYTRSVDWWTLGVVIYRMLVGEPPFSSDDTVELFLDIIRSEVSYPEYLSPEAIMIMKRLMCKNPENRLGTSPRDAEDVKIESFFAEINWEDMLLKKQKPPFILTDVDSEEDVSVHKSAEEVSLEISHSTTSENQENFEENESIYKSAEEVTLVISQSTSSENQEDSEEDVSINNSAEEVTLEISQSTSSENQKDSVEDENTLDSDEFTSGIMAQSTLPKNQRVLTLDEQKLFEEFDFTADWFLTGSTKPSQSPLCEAALKQNDVDVSTNITGEIDKPNPSENSTGNAILCLPESIKSSSEKRNMDVPIAVVQMEKKNEDDDFTRNSAGCY